MCQTDVRKRGNVPTHPDSSVNCNWGLVLHVRQDSVCKKYPSFLVFPFPEPSLFFLNTVFAIPVSLPFFQTFLNISTSHFVHILFSIFQKPREGNKVKSCAATTLKRLNKMYSKFTLSEITTYHKMIKPQIIS